MSNNRNRKPRRPETPILPAMGEQMQETVDRRTEAMIQTVDEMSKQVLSNESLVPTEHVEATVRMSIAWLMGRVDNPQDLEYLAVMLDIFVEEVKSGETVVEVCNAD